MSALAIFLSGNGFEVFGYDDMESAQTDGLKKERILAQNKKKSETAKKLLEESDVIVYTDAIPQDHFLLLWAKEKGKRLLSRAELLGKIARSFPSSIGVAGSHGKTTCTSMCAHVLKATGVGFTAHIGGIDGEFGNFYTNGQEFFLTEACEYKKNLLKIPCESAVVLNIDSDHMECYENEDDLTKTFGCFCKNSERAFVCADNEKCLSLGDFSTFGIENQFSDYRAVDLKEVGERYQFTVQEYGKELCKVRLKVRGKCNVYNALATFAVMRSYGFDEREIARGLEDFTAVKRRFEEIGEFRGVQFICDYAHHPKEILSTVQTAKSICKGRLFVVFQPHTYSRTKFLMKDFVSTLRGIENLLVYKTYPAREYFDETGSAKTLAENVGGCLYMENVRELKSWIKRTAKPKDLLLFLGAGDIYYVANRILSSLQNSLLKYKN